MIPPEQHEPNEMNDPPVADSIVTAGTDPAAAVQPPPLPVQQRRSTASKLVGLLIVVICFEVGVFLVVLSLDGRLGSQHDPLDQSESDRLVGVELFPGCAERLGPRQHLDLVPGDAAPVARLTISSRRHRARYTVGRPGD